MVIKESFIEKVDQLNCSQSASIIHFNWSDIYE